MHMQDVFKRHRTTFSFEFFPPKSEKGSGTLFKTIADLERLDPAFVSVTYGAGGSTRDLTNDLVVRINKETPLNAMPHLTCVCHSAEDIESLLVRYAEQGISNILALRMRAGTTTRTMRTSTRLNWSPRSSVSTTRVRTRAARALV